MLLCAEQDADKIPMMNEVTQGDCLELMKEVPSKSVELFLTDIPYGVVNRASAGIRVFDKADADIETFDLDAFMDSALRAVKGSVYIWCSTEQVSHLRAGLVARGMTTRLCIWEKSNPSPVNGQHLWLSGVECCVFGRFKGAIFNEHCKNTVWRYPVGRAKEHPTQKPLRLFEAIIRASSNPGDTVLDPCCGSGTTGVAAKRTERNSIQFELSGEYCEIARRRLTEATTEAGALSGGR